ncbi:MAG: hypothetical protein ABIQ64_00965 [Candidatus Saccharimonadales bacterium]
MIKHVVLVVMAALTLVATPVAATTSMATPLSQVAVCGSGFGNTFGFQPWYACLQDKYGDRGTSRVQIRSLNDVFLIIFPVVDWIIKGAVFISAGVIFLMLFKIATSRGNSSQYSTAISGIRDAIIGLVIAVISVAILNFVSGAFY